jgi:hypothetical protein
MDDAARAALSQELQKLQQLLASRQGRPGYADNVQAIKARVDEINQQLAAD